MADAEDAMDTDQPSNGAAADPGKGLVARAVPLSGFGEGMPYAPEDWPLPGDKWKWRVGRRLSQTGYFLDRFLYPPARLDKSKSASHKITLCSKSAFEQFVRKNIPDANIDALLESFIWRIPSRHANLDKELQIKSPSSSYYKFPHVNGRFGSKVIPRDGECKAGNSMCHPRDRTRKDSLPVMDCDLCHSGDDFCHDCCCILCCKTVNWASYGFIKCEGIVDDEFICGHIAHLDCALRAYLAGTVRGSIGLDAEYYCRRCDNKTDLITHLTRLLCSTKSVNSRDETEKLLNMGLCILRDSDRYEARKLQALIESMVVKLRDGVNLEEIWELGNNISTITTGFADDIIMLGTHNGAVYPMELKEEIVSSVQYKLLDGQRLGGSFISADYHVESSELETKIEQVLLRLKQSQEWEYNLTEEKLHAQKGVILGLYEDLKMERSMLDTYLSECDSFGCRVEQILEEHAKLDRMVQISQGFGQTPKPVLEKLFGLQIRDR